MQARALQRIKYGGEIREVGGEPFDVAEQFAAGMVKAGLIERADVKVTADQVAQPGSGGEDPPAQEVSADPPAVSKPAHKTSKKKTAKKRGG